MKRHYIGGQVDEETYRKFWEIAEFSGHTIASMFRVMLNDYVPGLHARIPIERLAGIQAKVDMKMGGYRHGKLYKEGK